MFHLTPLYGCGHCHPVRVIQQNEGRDWADRLGIALGIWCLGQAGRSGPARMGSYLWQSVEGEQHEKAVELLKAAQGTVKLVVRYTPRVLEEMEARFEKMRSARRRQQHQSYS